MAAAAPSSPPTGSVPDRQAIAIVCSLSGRVRVLAPPPRARDARLFEWLGAGAVLDVAQDGRAVLAFRDGRRQELAAGTRARLEPSGAAAERGTVRELPSLPALADVLALQREESAGSRAGAVRVRGPRMRGLYPGGGATSLAEETVLRFAPVTGAPRYRVEVRDAGGMLVYEASTEQPLVPIGSSALRPGTRYSWKVRTVDRPGPAAEGAESFRTLDVGSVEARQRLRREVDGAGDPDALALLAEMDRQLGLLREARLDRAAARTP